MYAVGRKENKRNLWRVLLWQESQFDHRRLWVGRVHRSVLVIGVTGDLLTNGAERRVCQPLSDICMRIWEIQIQIRIRRWKRVATQTSTARQRGRTKLEGSPSSHGPGYTEPRGKAARWTCPQRNNADKCHRSIHLSIPKDTRQSVSAKKIIRTQHTRLLIKVQNNPHWMTGVMWRRSTLRCEAHLSIHFLVAPQQKRGQRSCQRLSLRRAERITKDTRCYWWNCRTLLHLVSSSLSHNVQFCHSSCAC